MPVDTQRLAQQVMSRCDELAGCSSESGRITRLYLSEPMHAVHTRVTEWMRLAGLSPRIDHAGNCIGRLTSPTAEKALLIGSHLDTVPGAGRYDGVLGVLMSVAACHLLSGTSLPFHLDVVGFSEEEGVRFKMPYLGSSAVSGAFDPTWLDRTDANCICMRDAIKAFGLSPDAIADCKYAADEVIGFVEPHLEQGPVLERLDSPVGVVTGIAGQSRLRIVFRGEAGHAGTSPMEGRRDALVASAKLVRIVRDEAIRSSGLKATVGSLQVAPGTPNVIPGCVELTLDVRHLDDPTRETAVERLIAAGHRAADAEGCRMEVLEHNVHHSIQADDRLASLLSETVSEHATEPVLMESGAGHDAVVMGERFPMAMLFLRHPGGVSHHPDERVNVEDVVVGIEVLAEYLKKLSGHYQQVSLNTS